MLPKNLQNILNTINYAEFTLNILKLDISADPFKILLLLRDTEGSNEKVNISITAFGSVDFFIDKESNSSYIHLKSESPLLWRFNDTQCELYISGNKPKQIEKIVFDLLQIHDSLFQRHFPFDLQLLTNLYNGNGLLKKGSKKLLTAFANSLEKNGIETSIINEVAPKKDQELKILFLGYSYIIAKEFEFEILK